MRLKYFTTERERQRAQTRVVLSFFTWTAVSFFTVMSVIAVHYWLGWW